MARKKMGEILIENKVISPQDLDKALLRQKGSKKPLGQILEDMDMVLEEDIAKALAAQFGFTYVKKFARYRFPDEVLDKIDVTTAITHLVFPLKIDKKTLYLAMSNPLDMALQRDLSFRLAMRISPCVATPAEIREALKIHYQTDSVDLRDADSSNILLVDSQDIALNAVQAALQKEGFATFTAKNGVDGLKMAAQLQPDLIMTEIGMPRMDGVQMFKAIRSHHDTANIPIIALSGKAVAEEEARLLDMGFEDFIAKPINPVRMAARVRKALRLQRNSP